MTLQIVIRTAKNRTRKVSPIFHVQIKDRSSSNLLVCMFQKIVLLIIFLIPIINNAADKRTDSMIIEKQFSTKITMSKHKWQCCYISSLLSDSRLFIFVCSTKFRTVSGTEQALNRYCEMSTCCIRKLKKGMWYFTNMCCNVASPMVFMLLHRNTATICNSVIWKL